VGDAADIRNAYNWNVTSIARAFGLHRNTVSARLRDSSIQPVSRKGNAPLYALADIGPALFSGRGVGGSTISPDEMDPQSRRAWYQSENERLKFETDQRHLIPDDEMAREQAVLMKAVANSMDSLPDVLERECGMTGAQLELVQTVIDSIRETMYIKAAE